MRGRTSAGMPVAGVVDLHHRPALVVAIGPHLDPVVLRPPRGDGVGAVHQQVHEHLPQAHLAGVDRRHLAQVDRHPGAVAELVGRALQRPSQRPRQIDRGIVFLRRLGEAAQVGDDPPQPIGGTGGVVQDVAQGGDLHPQHLLGPATQPLIVFQRLGDQRQVGHDHRQRVVHLVGHARRHRAQRRQAIGMFEPPLQRPPLAEIAKDQHHAQRLVVVQDRRDADVQRVFVSRPVHHSDVGRGQHLHFPIADGLVQRQRQLAPFRRQAGLIACGAQVKHLGDRFADGLAERPAGQLFGPTVHEGDAALQIGAQHGVADRPQRGRQPALALPHAGLQRVPFQGDLQRRSQGTDLHRLDHVPVGRAALGPAKRHLVGVGAQEHHRHPEAVTQLLGRLDPVAQAAQPDVHQHDVRPAFRDRTDGLVRRTGTPDDFVTQLAEAVLDLFGYESFVFDNEYPGAGRSYRRHSISCESAPRHLMVVGDHEHGHQWQA